MSSAVVAGDVADALVGFALASLVIRGKNPSRWRELAVLAVGAAVVVLLSSLPVVGPWVELVVILLGLGAVLIDATAANRYRRGGWMGPATGNAADTADTCQLTRPLCVFGLPRLRSRTCDPPSAASAAGPTGHPGPVGDATAMPAL